MAMLTISTAPETTNDLAVWSFAHMAHHRDIIRLVMEQKQQILHEYVLDPFDPEQMSSWLEQHQQMHNEMNRALGLGGYDLSEVDWKDKSRLQAWIKAHFDEHVRVGQSIGLS